MIELDDTQHHDFLSDEARSGFGDDNESFGLGRPGGEKTAVEEKPNETPIALPLGALLTETVRETITEIAKEDFVHEQDIPKPEIVEKTNVVAATDIPFVDMDENSLANPKPRHQETTLVTPVIVFEDETAQNNSDIENDNSHPVIENLPHEFATDESDLSSSHSALMPDDVVLDETIAAAPIPPAHEAYIPPTYAQLDTILSENASTDGTRKVITIPSAEEQRKEDAQKAAASLTPKTSTRQNTWLRSAIAASLAALLLAALVALGYMLVRKTTLGSGARDLWATLTGERSQPTSQDSTSVALLDLTKKSQDNKSQEQGTQNVTNNAVTPNTQAPTPNTTPLANSQPAIVSQNQQPDTAQTASKNKSSTLVNSTTNKAANSGVSQAISTPAANSQLASSQLAKSQQPAQEKSQQSPPTTNQTTTQPAPTKQPATTKQADSQSASAKTADPKTSRPTNAAAIERRKTQQISGVFAIQVYATPSLADAEDWVERLKQRGMVNTMVTSQVIRGQTMYRVRFGLYNSLQDAERDAERFGYVGSWVVRLR